MSSIAGGARGFLEKEEFDGTIRFALTHLDDSLHGWETAAHALQRFEKAINRIDLKYSGKNILIVSHGCVLSLYFAKLLGELNEVYERWSRTAFCSYGIAKKGKVVKDIVGC